MRKSIEGLAILLIAGVMSLVGCDKKVEDIPVKTSEDNPIATIVIKDMGTIKAELYPKIAPNTVNNFIYLANSNFYNGLTFHRISKGFVIQGGDPEGTGVGGPGYSIKGEFSRNGFENTLSHDEGVLSMARSKNPDSAGSQFFIVTGKAKNLDGDYAAFGKVIEGMDIVKKIENVEKKGETPKTPVIIESISVDTKGVDYKEPKKVK